jgi:phosphatidylinositol glycan class K
VLLTDFFGNVQNVELTESKEVNNSLTETDPALIDSEPMFIEDPQAEIASSPKQSASWIQEQSHTFEIGNPDQSQTWRYVAFAVLSVAMGSALIAGSSLV